MVVSKVISSENCGKLSMASSSCGKRKVDENLGDSEATASEVATSLELWASADGRSPAKKLAKLPAGQIFHGTDFFLSAQGGAEASPIFTSVKRKAVDEVSVARVRQKVDGVQPVRRLQVLVAPVPYAKYGVAKGAISDSAVAVDCVIISKGWPGWAFGAQGAGFTIRALILLDAEWVSSVRLFLPEVNVVSYVSSDAQQPLLLAPVDVVLSDVDPPGCLRCWELAKIAVITFQRCRRLPQRWFELPAAVQHEAVGGVITIRQAYYLHLRVMDSSSPFLNGLLVEPTAFRDLASVMVNHTQSGVKCAPPVPISQLAPSVRCLNGGSCFHSGGWLPCFNRRCTVVTPCVFTKTKWCRRRLTADEWLGVFDMPSLTMKRLSEE